MRARFNNQHVNNKYLTAGFCTLFMMIGILFLIYMGIFALSNPDKPAWIGYVQDEKLKLFASEEEAA